MGWATLRDQLVCNDAFIVRWSKRFAAESLSGLFRRHAGQAATILPLRLEAHILDWTVKRKPTDGSTHWSTRLLLHSGFRTTLLPGYGAGIVSSLTGLGGGGHGKQ